MTPSGHSYSRPRLLDLYCKAGGAGWGYHLAGFDVVGVDIEPQPRYPFEFHQADALKFPLEGFDVVHASCPCQAHIKGMSALNRAQGRAYEHRDLIDETRTRLVEWGGPYIIENVVGAPLVDPVMLCGSMVGLPLRRHRLFESNIPLMAPRCQHGVERPRFPIGLGSPTRSSADRSSVAYVYGSTRYAGDLADRKAAMGIDWMTNAELTQAIPPAYTELLGHQLMAALVDRRVAAGS